MRLCAMDFGLKYMNRIFVYCSTFIAFYLILVILLLLYLFGLVNVQLKMITIVMSCFDIFCVLGVMLMMVYQGAQVNH